MEEIQLLGLISTFNNTEFSTHDFVLAVQKAFPGDWNKLKEEYGIGGKGAGTKYSAYSRISQYLNGLANQGKLFKCGEYRKSPEGWGNRWIRYWCAVEKAQERIFPDEICDPEAVLEGAKTTVTVNRYERDKDARSRCIKKYGVVCVACGFDFEKTYGEHGVGFIHIHHIKPLGEIGKEYSLDPIRDLVPLCPNCHAMVHRQIPALLMKELKALLKDKT